jgi:hypothetical protein
LPGAPRLSKVRRTFQGPHPGAGWIGHLNEDIGNMEFLLGKKLSKNYETYNIRYIYLTGMRKCVETVLSFYTYVLKSVVNYVKLEGSPLHSLNNLCQKLLLSKTLSTLLSHVYNLQNYWGWVPLFLFTGNELSVYWVMWRNLIYSCYHGYIIILFLSVQHYKCIISTMLSKENLLQFEFHYNI